MTMLYSLYAREGIVFAADSRVYRPGVKRRRLPPQRKVLRVARVGAATGLVGFYGLAEVGGQPMSSWLTTLIGRWPGSRDPEDFARLVVEGLNRDATPRERQDVSGLHFGAFRRSKSHAVPVFFHIVNTHGFDETTGLHKDPGDRWRYEEQLMGRDVARFNWNPARIRQHLRDRQRTLGMPHWYRNGDMPVFGPVTGFLDIAVAHMVHVPGYGAPDVLSAWERVARVLVVTTTQLARAFHKGPVPTIGDEARVLSVEWPASGL